MLTAAVFRAVRVLLVPAILLAPPPQSLRDAADSARVLIGTAVRPGLLSESAYAATLAREFNMVEPEDAMKWLALRPSSGKFDFKAGDKIVAFARAHNMKVRGHCLVWDHSNPGWLTQWRYKPRELSRLLQRHIATVMKHYAGQVFAWDVVNEGLDQHGHLRDSLWSNQPGIEHGETYIEQAFRWAHEADPQALLFYNDNGGEEINEKSDAIYAMVKDFKRRGVPIDGVGLQMHLSNPGLDTAPIAANIKRLSELGVQIHITELDIPLPIDREGHATNLDLQGQADLYRAIARACLQSSGCTAIQTWGFTDKYSWIGSHTQGTRGGALLFDRAYQPKPAQKALLEELSGNSRPPQ